MCAVLLYGDFSQFIMQVIDAGVVVVFGFVMAYVWFKVSDLITPIRVSKEVEIEGLESRKWASPAIPICPKRRNN